MSVERKPTNFNFELIKNSALELILRDGSHPPILIAQGSIGAVIGFPQQLPATADERLKWMWGSGFENASDPRLGNLEEIFFVGEGWMSEVRDGKMPESSPSKDPQRKEILMVSSLKVGSQMANLAIYEMVRDELGNLTDLVEIEMDAEEGARSYNRFLAVFLMGYREGKSSQNAPIN
jgi:hypothetical protein